MGEPICVFLAFEVRICGFDGFANNLSACRALVCVGVRLRLQLCSLSLADWYSPLTPPRSGGLIVSTSETLLCHSETLQLHSVCRRWPSCFWQWFACRLTSLAHDIVVAVG